MLIERYVTAEIARPFAAGLGLLVAVFVAFTVAMKLSDAAAGAIAPAAVVQLVALSTLVALEVLVPSTLYLATLFAIGRLHRDSEMAALAAAGVSEHRILRAVLIVGGCAAIVVWVLSVHLRPWAYTLSYTIEQEAMSRFDLANIRPGSFVDLGQGGYVLQAQEVDPAAAQLRSVFVHVSRGRHTQLISAESAKILDLDAEGARAVEFQDGYSYLLDEEGNQDVSMRFGSFIVRFSPEERMQRFRRKAIDTRTLGESRDAKDIAEYQWRTTTPLATLLLAVLAVPLARSGPRQSRFGIFVVALLAYLLMFISSGVVRNWIENGDMPASPGLVLAYLPATLLAAWLLRSPGRQPRWWRR
jgi:lipopolysaccharide export system permease protein